jgi:hypothetical protein
MMSAPRLAAIVAAALILGIGTTAVAQDQTGAIGADKIKALLLGTAGWKLDWTGAAGSDTGTAEFVYEARGQEVVVRIQQLSRSDGAPLPKCEREVKINADGMNMTGASITELLSSSMLRIGSIRFGARARAALNTSSRQSDRSWR